MAIVNQVPLSPLSFLRRASEVYRDKPAVLTSTGWAQSYGAFARQAEHVASRLRAVGCAHGRQVAVLSRNGPELLRFHFAVPGAGASLVALNIRLAATEYEYILADSQAELLFVEQALLDRIEPVAERLTCEVVVLPDAASMAPAAPSRFRTYEDWLQAGDVDQTGLQLPADENDRIAINYTSGTTGKPKGAVYTHRGAYLNAMGVALEFQLAPSSTYLWTLPMFHCNGWCLTWAVTAVGATHVTLADFDAATALELIGAHSVSHLSGAPVVLDSVAAAAETVGASFGHSVVIATGGAPPAPSSIAAMRRAGIEVVHLYGLTETYGPSLVCERQPEWEELDDDGLAAMLARQGVRTVNVEMARVLDAELRDVPADGATIGQIAVRSNSVVQGYFGDPDATRRAFHDGWFLTGDLAVVHADGYLEVRDRQKDIIISGGENISSIEVENVLLEHPAVREAAVVGRRDEKWGEVPAAFVTLVTPGSVTERELIDHVRERLAHFKAPKSIVFDELPRTSTGKIKKYELRGRAAEMDQPAPGRG